MNFHEAYLMPDIESSENTVSVGEITARRRVDQAFTCRVDDLCRVDFLMGTMNRNNTTDFMVTLWDRSGEEISPLRQGLFSAGEVRDNQWHSFSFQPVLGSRGKRFTLTVSSPNAKKGDAVTIWRDEHASVEEGNLWLSGVRYAGCLSFKTYGIKNRKIFQNYLDHLQDIRLRRVVPLALPLQFYLEVTTRCNLNCLICRPRVVEEVFEKKARGKGDFPFSGIWSLIPILETALSANMFGWGEPLCHPDFMRFIRFIREHNGNCMVTFNTNGMLLDPAKAAAILQLDVSKICFSAESHRKEIFEWIRKGADFDKFKKQVTNLVSQREKRGLRRPVIAMEQVLLRQNIDDLPDFIRFADTLGAREVFLENLHGEYPELEVKDYREKLDSFIQAMETAAERGIFLFGPAADRFRQLLPAGKNPRIQPESLSCNCFEPWQTIYVEHNGNIIPCCYQQTEKNLGNVLKENIIRIWRGEHYQKLRKGVIEKPFYPGCGACIEAGKVPGSIIPLIASQGFFMNRVTKETMAALAEPSFLEQAKSFLKFKLEKRSRKSEAKNTP